MGAQDVMVLSFVAVSVAYLGRSLWKTMKGRRRCSCSSGAATGRAGTCAAADSATNVRQPLVTVDQVGVPQRSGQDDRA